MDTESETKVGYKSPPTHSRFRKGISGNPGGKRRKPVAGTIDEALIAALARRATVPCEDGDERMSQLEAIVECVVEKARGGDKSCLRLVFEQVRRFDDVERGALAKQAEKAAEREFRAQQTAVDEAVAEAQPEEAQNENIPSEIP